jgi:HEAT repeat protein
MFRTDINKLKAGEKTKKLVRLLRNRDYVIRGNAVRALGEICPVETREYLISMLSDENEFPATEAFKALVRNDLADSDEVFSALRETSRENIYGFLACGEDAARVIRQSGAAVPLNDLIRLCRYGGSDFIEEWLLSNRDTALEALIDDLKTPRNRNSLSYSAPTHTIHLLGRLSDKRAVPDLINALNDEDDAVKRAAAEVLGRLGDSAAVEPVRSLLNSGNEALVKDAYDALRMLGWKPGPGLEAMQLALINEDAGVFAEMDPEQIEYLTKIVQDDSSGYRSFAAKLLGEKDTRLLREAWGWNKKVIGIPGKSINEGPELDLLYKVLKDMDSNSGHRLFIVTGLRWLPENTSIVEALIPGPVIFTWSGVLGREGIAKELIGIADKIHLSPDKKYLVWGPNGELLSPLLDAKGYPRSLIKIYHGEFVD